jgi:acetate kinase
MACNTAPELVTQELLNDLHRTMPRVAKLLPIPRRYDAKGVQRYGFPGLSYAYLIEELAHLGNGASMAPVRDGKSIDTSMTLTPTSGLVISTVQAIWIPAWRPFCRKPNR